jgi:hypothetical protein
MLDAECPFCLGKVEYSKHDWVILMDGPDERVLAHSDCIFDEPRIDAPDLSDNGDGFNWEDFWGGKEARADAERENLK